jgi:cytochrome c-type biogenesis protein
MDSLLVAAGSAFWLGLLTSISPCPLATNIVAVSFIGREVGSPGRAFLSGLLYTVGRVLTYIGLGAIVVAGLISIPAVANFLQDYMDKILGPLLVLTGLLLLGSFGLRLPGMAGGDGTRRLAERGGLWGAVPLGILFALSLCPVSAALFFGSLIPLALQHKSYLLMPSLYGLGTGLPVIVFGFVIAYGAGSVGKLFHRVATIERWLRRVTAATFIVIGLHYILRYNFGLY